MIEQHCRRCGKFSKWDTDICMWCGRKQLVWKDRAITLAALAMTALAFYGLFCI